jgi:hypothetical protein
MTSTLSLSNGFELAGASESASDLREAADDAKDKGKSFCPVTVSSATVYVNVDHVRWIETDA